MPEASAAGPPRVAIALWAAIDDRTMCPRMGAIRAMHLSAAKARPHACPDEP